MYSQNDEEKHIVDWLVGKCKIERGYFLDIGAYDGKKFSNTRALVELGWSGVCFEPSPSIFNRLVEACEGFDVVCYDYAVVDNSRKNPHTVKFYDSNGDAVSTSSVDHVNKWSRAGTKFKEIEVVAVPAIYVQKHFLQSVTIPTMVNIDVESANIGIFESFDWEKLNNVKLVCVEYDNKAAVIESRLFKCGYKKIAMNGENVIMARL